MRNADHRSVLQCKYSMQLADHKVKGSNECNTRCVLNHAPVMCVMRESFTNDDSRLGAPLLLHAAVAVAHSSAVAAQQPQSAASARLPERGSPQPELPQHPPGAEAQTRGRRPDLPLHRLVLPAVVPALAAAAESFDCSSHTLRHSMTCSLILGQPSKSAFGQLGQSQQELSRYNQHCTRLAQSIRL